MELFSNPHKRKNILTSEWVLVSPHRTKRPWQGKQDTPQALNTTSYDESCYLCPGNDRAGGAKNPTYDSVFSFQNDFAALLEAPEQQYSENLLEAESESGICKVVCFSPNHSLTLPLMEVEGIVKVIQLWQKEYTELGSKEDINYVQIFENKGAIMGCSNPHPHGQVWGQRSLPEELKKKDKNQSNYWIENKSNLLQDYLKIELDKKERIIFENDSFVVLVPFWAVWPFETMIIPKRTIIHVNELNEKEVLDFADAIKRMTIRYDNLFETSFPYSSGIHQAPTNGEENNHWCMHMSFYPPLLRSASVKKFMVGYEMVATPQRDITAESAASQLRDCSELHYSKK